jgi:hypothetical protein
MMVHSDLGRNEHEHSLRPCSLFLSKLLTPMLLLWRVAAAVLCNRCTSSCRVRSQWLNCTRKRLESSCVAPLQAGHYCYSSMCSTCLYCALSSKTHPYTRLLHARTNIHTLHVYVSVYLCDCMIDTTEQDESSDSV